MVSTVRVSGDYAFINGSDKLTILDITDYESPELVISYQLPGDDHVIKVLDVNDEYVFIKQRGGADLWIIDVHNPRDPQALGQYNNFYGEPDNLKVINDLAYYVNGPYLIVIDVSDPSNPTEIGNIHLSANSLDIRGNFAYVGGLAQNFSIIDISDPENMAIVGEYRTPGAVMGVSVQGNYAYLACRSSGLGIIDISDPENPSLSGYFEDENLSALNVKTVGNYAYLSELGGQENAGLWIIDISDPSTPVLAGFYYSPFWVRDIDVIDNYAFLADRFDGFYIIRNDDPLFAFGEPDILPGDFPILLPNYPNPFNSITNIHFQLPATNHLSLSVYDLYGREVAVLTKGLYIKGNHKIIWNASDLPSGMYLVQLKTEDRCQIMKTILIR